VLRWCHSYRGYWVESVIPIYVFSLVCVLAAVWWVYDYIVME